MSCARATAHGRRGVILVIDHYVPEPDRDAGSRTMICIIHALLKADMVVKFWPHNLHYSPGYTEALQDIGVEVAYGGDADTFRQWLADNGDDLDHVLLCRPQVAAAFLPELKRHAGISLLYYGGDLHFSRMRQEAKELGDRRIARQADAMETLERSVWRDVDVVLYPSHDETAIVTDIEPDVVACTLLPYSFADFATPRAPVARTGHPVRRQLRASAEPPWRIVVRRACAAADPSRVYRPFDSPSPVRILRRTCRHWQVMR